MNTAHRTALATPYEPYRRGLLLRREVRELSRLHPPRMLRDMCACWCTIVAAWMVVGIWPQWWLVLAGVPVIGTRYYALYIVGHDGMHRRLLRNRKRNDLFCDLFLLGPVGAITRINNRNHLAHHGLLASHDDPDRHKYSCVNKATIARLLAFLTGVVSLTPAIGNVFLGRQRAVRDVAKSMDAARYRMRDVAIVLGWQALLIGALSWAIGWWAYPVLWLVPVYLFTYLAGLARSFLEHSHPEADDVADGHRLVSYRSNRLERLFLAPMHMNFHAAHHLWPSIPYYNLPAVDRLMSERYRGNAIVWRGSYLGYLWRYCCALPLRQCIRRNAPGTGAPGDGSDTKLGVEPAAVAGGALNTVAPRITEEPVDRCPLCGESWARHYAQGQDYEYATCSNVWRFVQCLTCGHVWLNPRPASGELPVIYPAHYYAYGYERVIHPVALRAKELLDRHKLRRIVRTVGERPQAYLDIGCGTGRYMRAMLRAGLPPRRIHGLDIDPSVVEQLSREGFQVVCQPVEQCDAFASASFQLITMFHVLEHLDGPSDAVRRIAGWLAPGGVLAIETPNLDSLDARAFRRTYWGGYHFPRHWNLFSPATLARGLEDAGLEVMATWYQTGHSFWMYSFRHLLNSRGTVSRLVARWFDPRHGVPLLVAFTSFDLARAALGFRTSSMLMLARRRASPVGAPHDTQAQR